MLTDDDRIENSSTSASPSCSLRRLSRQTQEQRAPLTEAGLVVGTPAYMSPFEQADGRKVDARSDIFSFGSLLYEMVTGQCSFTGESSPSTLAKNLNDEPPPPSQIAPSVTPDVERAILRCLRKDPARRYQTMADLKVALDDLAEELTSGRLAQVAPPRAVRRGRWAWVAVILVVLGAAFFAWQARQQPDTTPALRAIPLTSLPGCRLVPIVLARRQPRRLHLERTETGQSRRLRPANRGPVRHCG